MKKNMGSVDRIVRLLIAAVAVFLFYNGTLTGIAGTVALVVAVIFTLTSLVSFCPLYAIFNLSTCPVSPEKK
jgi:hypothetical protein